MTDHIDVDCSAMLTDGRSVEDAGDELIDVVERTINGRLTCAEALGHREFTLTKLYRSA
jgi:(2R)-sulfolactate sulfo-lyase subunit beta